MKIKYVIIFVLLLIGGNFLRLYIQDKTIPHIEIREEMNYNKKEAQKENDLSNTTKKFDINEVSFEDLLKLGFSKSRATRIIEYRNEIGVIFSIDELKNIPRFGESGVKQAKKYLITNNEKLNNYKQNYNKDVKKYNINSLDEDSLKILGFSKKEIKKLLPEIEKNNIKSNIDLENIIGLEKYKKVEKYIKFIE